jgi:hypothetical protein
LKKRLLYQNIQVVNFNFILQQSKVNIPNTNF